MPKWVRYAALFVLGGGGYVGLELGYRGRSHKSMFFAGGASFLLLGRLGKKGYSLPRRALQGMLTVTAVELVTGLLVNRDYRVWDYRDRRFHFLGQICPAFMALWMMLSLAAMGLYRAVEKLWE